MLLSGLTVVCCDLSRSPRCHPLPSSKIINSTRQRQRRRSGPALAGPLFQPTCTLICSQPALLYADSAMASVSRPSCGNVGLPLKLHSSQGLFFPKTAILMLRERFLGLIAENTCEIFFPRFARTDQHFTPLRYK